MPHSRKSLALITLAALAAVFIPFLFWHGAWFGRMLEDRELVRYLSSKEKPRRTQHALVQIGERIRRGDPFVKQWYDEVIRASGHSLVEIRSTAAWVMGQDTRSEEFHGTLLRLLNDRDHLVRRNAALALVRFGDASGRREVVTMLKSRHEEQVWEALRALYLIGRLEDIKAVESLVQDPRLADRTQQQARLTAEAIRKRTE